MKYLILSLVLFSFTACKKNSNKAIVDKDCTGSYLTIKDNDYRVCNAEILDSYQDGDELKVTYKKVNNCEADTGIYCELYHPYKSHIEILEIK